MFWLLISNTGNRNPGDEWIRFGVQRIIREVDKSPEFIVKNKELIEDQDSEVEFDKAIWCGSPLFWSHQFQGCWENYWWDKWLNGWLFRDKNKILVLGVGDYVGNTIQDKARYAEAIRKVKSQCWQMVVRNRINDDNDLVVSCCPSVFAVKRDTSVKTLRLCNLMPDGGHCPFIDEHESEIWNGKVKTISDFLRYTGFEIICHVHAEEGFSESLGWPPQKIHYKPKTSEDYLPIYSKAQAYVGNRLHGAVLTIGAGGRALAIGYDSRLGMVSYVGGTVMKPSQVTQDAICRWMDQTSIPYDWRPEYEKQVEIVRQFSEA